MSPANDELQDALPTSVETDEIRRLLEWRHHDPFRVLGRHPHPAGGWTISALVPGAQRVAVIGGPALRRYRDSDLFHGEVGEPFGSGPYQLEARWPGGGTHTWVDPYTFAPLLTDAEITHFASGEGWQAWRSLGAQPREVAGIAGLLFAVWAPEAERVSVVGDFNDWDGRRHMLRSRGWSGLWEIFVPDLEPGARYKFEMRNRHTGELLLRADPWAHQYELRPDTASVLPLPSRYQWQDDGWMAARQSRDWLHEPMSIYELHPGSWRRRGDGSLMDWSELAEALVPWVKELGFTHIELMPVTEYPLDESWGYQVTGYFASTRRHGDPDGLRYLVDLAHRHGIGVLLDWVPGHFPRDEHALARFDGSALFEYPDPARGHHPDWGTLVFNYGRNEVRSFLLASACYWLEEFHIDGLRVDAVASMLYLDYSREAGAWQPNVHGGNENLDAIDFLRRLNSITHQEFPGTLMIAEESTAWPGVSRPVDAGGLGFSMKWNMGWMHDTLAYLAHDPVHRRYHHDRLSFSAVYAFSENFVLPLSHDEVVHGKRSLLGRMPGDEWQRFANLRLALSYQWLFPGKKLLFMGGELAQPGEWDHRDQLPWQLLEYAGHAGMRQLVSDLNRLYRERPELHRHEFDSGGFAWLRWDDAEQSTLAFLRRDGSQAVVVLLNFTPVPRMDYRVGVPSRGPWKECFNSDSRFYGGGDLGNPLAVESEELPWMGQTWSVRVTVPPLGAIVLVKSP
ncbi:MAG: 1,4-alpha-glucan branching protein GlgB [Chromatiales bacterium]|nr:1,4-alpha-glucan branching protein GlgB [Chromatiales bacterium]